MDTALLVYSQARGQWVTYRGSPLRVTLVSCCPSNSADQGQSYPTPPCSEGRDGVCLTTLEQGKDLPGVSRAGMGSAWCLWSRDGICLVSLEHGSTHGRFLWFLTVKVMLYTSNVKDKNAPGWRGNSSAPGNWFLRVCEPGHYTMGV